MKPVNGYMEVNLDWDENDDDENWEEDDEDSLAMDKPCSVTQP